MRLLDRQLLGGRAEEAMFEILDAEFEQALFSRQRPQGNDG